MNPRRLLLACRVVRPYHSDMATKRKKEVWPKIKLEKKATATEIIAGLGITPAQMRAAEASLEAVKRENHLRAVAAARTRAANKARRSAKPRAAAK